MARAHAHPMNRTAPYIDEELEMCKPVSLAVVKATNSSGVADLVHVYDMSLDLCHKLTRQNFTEIYHKRSVYGTQKWHIGRLKALRESLKQADCKRPEPNLNAILVVGYYLSFLPNYYKQTSIFDTCPDYACQVTWQHWLELAPICRRDVGEYLMVEIPRPKPPGTEPPLIEPLVDPHIDEIQFSATEVYHSIRENRIRFTHALEVIVRESLTPRQVRLRRDQLTRRDSELGSD